MAWSVSGSRAAREGAAKTACYRTCPGEQRFVLTDRFWHRLETHLPGKSSDAGATAKDNRLFLEAVFWRVRTGCPWRDPLPDGACLYA